MRSAAQWASAAGASGRRLGRCDSSTGWSWPKMVFWKSINRASGESKSFIAMRVQATLLSSVTGQTNMAMDSFMPSMAVLPASGTLVSTAM